MEKAAARKGRRCCFSVPLVTGVLPCWAILCCALLLLPMGGVVAGRPVDTNEAVDQCDVCHLLVKALAKLGKEPYIQRQIIAYVQNICNYLPPSLESACVVLVANQTAITINLLEEQNDPCYVCSRIGVCPQGKAPVVPPLPLSHDSSLQCTVCQFVLGQLAAMLAQPETQQAIIKDSEIACKYFTVDQQPLCLNFIHQYGPAVFETILTNTTPDWACQTLDLCLPSYKKQQQQQPSSAFLQAQVYKRG
ncbi:hypothetical protein QOT17_021650 [Balamuthia mandrillaris]